MNHHCHRHRHQQAGAEGFQRRKDIVLGKRDKSSAGRIDPKAVDACASINRRVEYYTTSSCAGRCFLYRGDGVKSHQRYAPTAHGEDDGGGSGGGEEDDDVQGRSGGGLGFFERYRVNHDIVRHPSRYFDLTTLDLDPTGGGDPVRTVGYGREDAKAAVDGEVNDDGVWLRFEPFILHVACRSLPAAHALLAASRPSFKNVGLTSWSENRYIVAIWGDEGLDMPLSLPGCGTNGGGNAVSLFTGQEEWLAGLVNEKHRRNWDKIDRFAKAVRDMPDAIDDVGDPNGGEWFEENGTFGESSDDGGDAHEAPQAPRRFDVIGDVALLSSLPPGTEQEREDIGKKIMAKNRAIKVCAARAMPLIGSDRAPGGVVVLAGAQRSPLITTHSEHGIKCVVDIRHTFFSPRMGPERLRICQQVARGENVLVLFAGVGLDAMQIAGRTEASSVLAIEMNPVAAECARRGKRMLVRNRAVKCARAAERLEIVEGNVLEILPTLEKNHYDRIVAPRPKEGKLDGDLGLGDGGVPFLEALLPLLKEEGGECHWYDFASDQEIDTNCIRTRKTIENVCRRLGYSMEVIHTAQVGSIAKRQLRICMDFRLTGRKA